MHSILAIWVALIVLAIVSAVGAWFYVARRQPPSLVFRRRRTQVINFPDRRKVNRAP